MPLAGRPMIEWSLEALRASPSVSAIVVAAPAGERGRLAEAPGLTVVPGGATRAESVANALESVATPLVAVHDAARPLLTPRLLEALVADLDAAPAAAGVIAAAPVTDTIKRVASSPQSSTSEVSDRSLAAGGAESDRSLAVERTEDRSRLWAAQTPQVFRTEALREAVAAEGQGEATDEALLVERAGGAVLIHPVEGRNLKVTTPLDLRVAELLLRERSGGSQEPPAPIST